MIKESITVDEVIKILNNFLLIDRGAITKLIGSRVPCNFEMSKHPDIQVGIQDGIVKVGFLGILNGLLGTDKDGFGSIAAEIYNGEVRRFYRRETDVEVREVKFGYEGENVVDLIQRSKNEILTKEKRLKEHSNRINGIATIVATEEAPRVTKRKLTKEEFNQRLEWGKKQFEERLNDNYVAEKLNMKVSTWSRWRVKYKKEIMQYNSGSLNNNGAVSGDK